MLLYSLGLLAAIIVSSPYWLFRMVREGKYRDGLSRRLGAVPRGLCEFTHGRPTIWVHAVSVGEVVAAKKLVCLLDKFDPDVPVAISTTTRTGHALAQQLFALPDHTATRVFYYPLDFRWIVRRYLHALRPRTIILMESELWPRMIVEAHKAKVPVVVANARISDRSLPRYRALRKFWRPFLQKLTLVLAQSEQDRQRFIDIGLPAERAQTAGNLKFDVRTDSTPAIVQKLRTHIPSHVRALVAGSTLPGEETLLLAAFRALLAQFPDLVLILAPRHPEGFDTVEELLRGSRMPYRRRSSWIDGPTQIPAGSVFLLDSIGDLASVYSLASVAFVGGSLVPEGGHNPLEPAQFAVPIVMGPYTENFRGMVATLLEHGAIRITPPEKLTDTLANLLISPAASAMGERARQVFQEHAGASERCFAEIVRLLQANTVPISPQVNT